MGDEAWVFPPAETADEHGIVGILMKQTQEAADDDTSWKFRQLVGQTASVAAPVTWVT